MSITFLLYWRVKIMEIGSSVNAIAINVSSGLGIENILFKKLVWVVVSTGVIEMINWEWGEKLMVQKWGW